MTFRAPYFGYDDLRRRAEAFLAEYHPTRSIPVPIEFIVECTLGIEIVPVPGLQNAIETVSFLSADLTEIFVDEFVLRERPNRYRYSLAHELGHVTLHGDIYRQYQFTTIAQWKDFLANEINEREYGYLETHAYSLAGLILVPTKELKEAFFDLVLPSQDEGIDFDDPGTGAREYVEAHIAGQFDVSRDVVHRRVEYDKLWHE